MYSSEAAKLYKNLEDLKDPLALPGLKQNRRQNLVTKSFKKIS